MREAQSPPAGNPTLSVEQWQGLAQLADLINALSGPFAGPITGSLDRIMGLSARHDLATLAEEVLETTETLHESGLLALLRKNAALLADSIRQLAPLLGTLAGNLAKLPVSEIEHDFGRLQRLPERTRNLLHGVQAAMDDATADAANLGGLKGLLHLLRDPAVQRGIRALAVLPVYLEGRDVSA